MKEYNVSCFMCLTSINIYFIMKEEIDWKMFELKNERKITKPKI